MYRLALLFCIVVFANIVNGQVVVTKPVTLMGSRFEITINAVDKHIGIAHIDTVIKEIVRIENLISEWIPTSQVSLVNQNAGIKPVNVNRELFDLTKRAISFSYLSEGAFDISVAAMDKIWRFDGSMTALPSAHDVANSIKNVGYENIVLDSINTTIFLKKKGMKIGFGSTGKGYAADRGRLIMMQKGIKGGIINASGDIATWGTQPQKKPWLIGITNPFFEDKNAAILKLTNNTVTTSGSYEKFVEFNGVRYAHIINPKTGYPSKGFISVTVVGPSAEIANALSTSIMVLGKANFSKLVVAFPQYSWLIIKDDGHILMSNNFKGKVKQKLRKIN